MYNKITNTTECVKCKLTGVNYKLHNDANQNKVGGKNLRQLSQLNKPTAWIRFLRPLAHKLQ